MDVEIADYHYGETSGAHRGFAGEHLAEDLDALGMSAAELARRIDVPTNRVTAILNGQRAITGNTALLLAAFISLGRAQSSGSICRPYMNSGWLKPKAGGQAIKKLPTLKRASTTRTPEGTEFNGP